MPRDFINPKVRIRNIVVDRVIEDAASDNKFLDEYAKLGWTLTSAIVLYQRINYKNVRFYFTTKIIEEA